MKKIDHGPRASTPQTLFRAPAEDILRKKQPGYTIILRNLLSIYNNILKMLRNKSNFNRYWVWFSKKKQHQQKFPHSFIFTYPQQNSTSVNKLIEIVVNTENGIANTTPYKVLLQWSQTAVCRRKETRFGRDVTGRRAGFTCCSHVEAGGTKHLSACNLSRQSKHGEDGSRDLCWLLQGQVIFRT